MNAWEFLDKHVLVVAIVVIWIARLVYFKVTDR